MRALLLCLALACGLPALGQLLLRINDAPPTTISQETLRKLPRHTAVLNDHGKEVHFEGVLLRDVLIQNGVPLDNKLRGKQLATYISALANDGYQIVFGLAEFDPTITDGDILLADKRDGQPLAATEGPLRIIVPHDKRPARSLKMLRELDVIELKNAERPLSHDHHPPVR
jgi:hypothetical protein